MEITVEMREITSKMMEVNHLERVVLATLGVTSSMKEKRESWREIGEPFGLF